LTATARAASGGLFRQASVYAVSNVLNAAIPFVLLPIFTRVLSPEDYGRATMFFLVVTVLGALVGLNVHGAVSVRHFQLPGERLAEYVGACLGVLAVSAIAVIGIVALAGTWLEQATQVPARWLLLAVIVATLNFIVTLRLTLWQAQGKAARYGALQVSNGLLNGVLSLFFVLALGMAWEGRALGQAAGTSMVAALAIFALLSSREVRLPHNLRDAKDAIAFGIPLIPHTLGSMLIVSADRFIIASLLDVAQAGVYMVALQIGMVLGLLAESFGRAFGPWLMARLRHPDPTTAIRIVRGTYLYFVAIFALAIALGLAAPLLFGTVVGEQFRDAAEVVPLIALGQAFSGAYYMVATYIFFAGKTGRLAAITLVAGGISVVATWHLVQAAGLYGAALAFVLSQAVVFLGTWWLSHRVHPMPWLAALVPGRAH
jgi:O-antigen/teichoic acid export membrane protein